MRHHVYIRLLMECDWGGDLWGLINKGCGDRVVSFSEMCFVTGDRIGRTANCTQYIMKFS